MRRLMTSFKCGLAGAGPQLDSGNPNDMAGTSRSTVRQGAFGDRNQEGCFASTYPNWQIAAQ